MKKRKILLVGDSPFSVTGNGHMMAALLEQINYDDFEVACFGANQYPVILDNNEKLFDNYKFKFIPAEYGNDPYGASKLVSLIPKSGVDIVLFVGVDVWTFSPIYRMLRELATRYGFITAGLFPYDLQYDYQDWFNLFDMIDFPYVYSRYGYEVVSKNVPRVGYFRPPLYNMGCYAPLADDMEILKVRRELLRMTIPHKKLVGYIGCNQVRKDPIGMLDAFARYNRKFHDASLLFCCSLSSGTFNLGAYAKSIGLSSSDLIAIDDARYQFSDREMGKIIASLDCLVNCTINEGLSWTPLQSLLCRIPTIVSQTTAHLDYAGVFKVPANTDTFLNVGGSSGPVMVPSKKCAPEDIAEVIEMVLCDADCFQTANTTEDGFVYARGFVRSPSNINTVLNGLLSKASHSNGARKSDSVLFLQHSSAGDVLMTTACFKGIKEAHPGKKLTYMTQRRYFGILEGNPYIDELLEWNPAKAPDYEVVYRPHSDKILRGGWNHLDTRLYEMYPHFCKVQASDMFIKPAENVRVLDKLSERFILVHTTGGDVTYRVYPYMDAIHDAFHGDYTIIQIGSEHDLKCKSDIDLRGKLEFSETALLMEHAAAAVVVDSFPAHLAGYLGTKVVVLFGPAPARVTQPKVKDPKDIILLEPNRLDVCPLTTSCWGAPGIRPCSTPCIETIPPDVVVSSLGNLLGDYNG